MYRMRVTGILGCGLTYQNSYVLNMLCGYLTKRSDLSTVVVRCSVSYYSGRKAPNHKMQMICFFTRAGRLRVIKCRWFFSLNVQLSNLRSTALIRHCFVQAKWPTLARFVCINKRYQAVESPSYVYRSSAN